VSSDASAEDIVRAYRNVSHCVHKDSGGQNALFELVETAHKTLADLSLGPTRFSKSRVKREPERAKGTPSVRTSWIGQSIRRS